MQTLMMSILFDIICNLWTSFMRENHSASGIEATLNSMGNNPTSAKTNKKTLG